MANNNNEISFLSEIPVSSFTKPELNGGEVLVIKTTETIKDAMKKLLELNILSAPLYDEEEEEYTGMVDMISFVCFLTVLFESAQVLQESLSNLVSDIDHFSNEEIKTAADLGDNKFNFVDNTGNLMDIIKLLTEGSRRVCVFSEENKLENIITQSNVVNLLFGNQARFPGMASKTIKELNLGNTVVGASINSNISDIFNTLKKKSYYAMPIVGDNGAIVANISAKDIKTILRTTENVRLLYGTVSEFLVEMHRDDVEEKNPAISVKETDTLSTVLEKLCANKIHRVYVIDNKLAPSKIITLTDVLKCFLPSSE